MGRGTIMMYLIECCRLPDPSGSCCQNYAMRPTNACIYNKMCIHAPTHVMYLCPSYHRAPCFHWSRGAPPIIFYFTPLPSTPVYCLPLAPCHSLEFSRAQILLLLSCVGPPVTSPGTPQPP